MKANVILAAIAISMIGAVGFAQEAQTDATVNAVRGAVEGTRAAGAVSGVNSAAAGALSGAGSLLDVNEQATANSMLPASQIQTVSQPGVTCGADSGFTKLSPAQQADLNADHTAGIAKDGCMYQADENIDGGTANLVVNMENAVRQNMSHSQYSDETPSQKLSDGEVFIAAGEKELHISKQEMERRGVCLALHPGSNGQIDECFVDTAFDTHSVMPVAAQDGITPSNVDCSL